MLTQSEQKFLQDKDLTGFAPGYSIINLGESKLLGGLVPYGVRDDRSTILKTQ
jgi:hypothetical protein